MQCHGVSYFSVYLFISCKGSITSVGKEKAIFMLSFTRKYVVSVTRGFLFPWCLGKDTLFYCGTPCAFHTIIHSWIAILQEENENKNINMSNANERTEHF